MTFHKYLKTSLKFRLIVDPVYSCVEVPIQYTVNTSNASNYCSVFPRAPLLSHRLSVSPPSVAIHFVGNRATSTKDGA
jgi:hypothetical protein